MNSVRPRALWLLGPPGSASWLEVMRRRRHVAHLRRLIRMTSSRRVEFDRNHASRVIQVRENQHSDRDTRESSSLPLCLTHTTANMPFMVLHICAGCMASVQRPAGRQG